MAKVAFLFEKVVFAASFFKPFELFGKTGGAVRATARFRTDNLRQNGIPDCL